MNWKKVKLGDLCSIEKGKTGIQKAIPGEYPLVVTAEDRKSHNEYQFDDEAVIIPLVSGTGHGHASIKRLHFQSGKFALGSILCAVIPKDKSVLNSEYLFRFLNLNKERELVDRMKGMANVTLPIKEIAKIEIPLPTLEAQIEFVEKYRLLEANSEDVSSELKHQLDVINQIRQAFLREVIRGKLIYHSELVLTSPETGQELLTKIKAEKKLKKEKELPPITKDEIPFEIPKHWTWCRLGDICTIKGGKRVSNGYKLLRTPTNHIYIRVTDMKKGTIQNNDLHYIDDNMFSIIKQYVISKDDIYITIAGTIGQVGLVPDMFDKMNLSENAAKFVFSNLNKFWFKNLLSSDISQSQFNNNTTKITAQPKLALTRIATTIIPLPPLHEQEQIVAKLDELMAFCDDLEQSIKESQRYNEMLLQQVLREALQPKEEVKAISLENRKLALPLKTVLGAHIVDVCNTTDFGRVKFQKLLFLTEYHCKIDFESHYVQKAAGPHDDVLIKSIENEFKRQRFFEVKQEISETNRVRYTKLPNASQINSMFLENFGEEVIDVNSLLMRLRAFSWVECEVIATIYAVWNNRLIKGQTITDEYLFEDFMAWSSRKSNFSTDFYKKLLWMREENIVPAGWGTYVDKPEKKMA